MSNIRKYLADARATANENFSNFGGFADDGGMGGRLLNLVSDFCASVKCRHVNIMPDEGFWRKIEDGK